MKKWLLRLLTVHPKVCPWCGEKGCWTDGDPTESGGGTGLPVWLFVWAKWIRPAIWWATGPFTKLRNRWFFED